MIDNDSIILLTHGFSTSLSTLQYEIANLYKPVLLDFPAENYSKNSITYIVTYIDTISIPIPHINTPTKQSN